MLRLKLNQKGDTIVEVMIAMAVASLVIGSAYSISNKSLANSRQAQEHSEAARIAQSQIEQIRQFARLATVSSPLFQPNRAFCVGTNGQLTEITGMPASEVSKPGNDATRYPGGCQNLGSVNYRVGFTKNSTDPFNTNTFSVYVNWDGATGKQDQVSMSYRAYPGE